MKVKTVMVALMLLATVVSAQTEIPEEVDKEVRRAARAQYPLSPEIEGAMISAELTAYGKIEAARGHHYRVPPEIFETIKDNAKLTHPKKYILQWSAIRSGCSQYVRIAGEWSKELHEFEEAGKITKFISSQLKILKKASKLKAAHYDLLLLAVNNLAEKVKLLKNEPDYLEAVATVELAKKKIKEAQKALKQNEEKK